MDFTLQKYTELLQIYQKAGYHFATFEMFCNGFSNDCFVVLRHDVDMKAENSLVTAKIEASLDIRASYYFRVVGESNRPEIIKEIASLGHEIGYHYEDMAICKGNVKKAITHFNMQLDYFRQFYPVKTICMHGAPHSRFDGRDLWKHFDYHDFGIIGEPYLDIDFAKVFYVTDSGRRWDGFNVSLRDKVPVYQDEWIKKGWVYHNTNDILNAIENGSFPKQLMMTTHPQRWTDNTGQWLKELFVQSAKNIVKGIMVRLD